MSDQAVRDRCEGRLEEPRSGLSPELSGGRLRVMPAEYELMRTKNEVRFPRRRDPSMACIHGQAATVHRGGGAGAQSLTAADRQREGLMSWKKSGSKGPSTGRSRQPPSAPDFRVSTGVSRKRRAPGDLGRRWLGETTTDCPAHEVAHSSALREGRTTRRRAGIQTA